MGKDHPKLKIDSFVGRFRVVKHVGAGGFGEIYSVMDPSTSKMCAMKIEYLGVHKSSLKLEIAILQELSGSKYFPKLIDQGKTQTIRYYVMELLGASLQNMRAIAPRKRFSMHTTLRIALESLKAIEEFHNHGYVHRDIKPGNFLIRDDDEYPICLIDFGLCRKYIDDKGKIIPPRDEPGFTGTCRYASVNAHNYNELGRRDDIISWIYTMVELADSKLPWPGTKDREATRTMKRDITATSLLKSFSDEILDIYREVRKLKYEDKPDYDLYKKLLQDAINECTEKRAGFDWEYYSRKLVEEVSPDLALGPPKQTSAKSLSSTKAFLGPPRKPFVMPTFIPEVFNPTGEPSNPPVTQLSPPQTPTASTKAVQSQPPTPASKQTPQTSQEIDINNPPPSNARHEAEGNCCRIF